MVKLRSDDQCEVRRSRLALKRLLVPIAGGLNLDAGYSPEINDNGL